MILRMPMPRFPVTLLLLASLSACNLARDYQRPGLPDPQHWRNLAKSSAPSKVNPQWWLAFGNQELDRLIQVALAHNYDLAAARQRVAQARAQAKIAGAPLLPSVSATGDFTDRRDHDSNRQNQSGWIEVAYEVDLWGANRARRNSGTALLQSESFARDALQLVLMAEVARQYFQVLALAEQQHIAREFLDNVAATLVIVQARLKAGAASQIEVAQQQTELATAQANLNLLNQQRIIAENALAILLGKPPQFAAVRAEAWRSLRLPEPASVQPASLLERRPDLRQAEMALVAAEADITVARAAFYPSLQLRLEPLLTSAQPASLIMTTAATLTQPIFQGGRLTAELARTQARNAELVENYRQTLLAAWQEAEDAAATRHHSGLRLKALGIAVDQARVAYRLSQERYRVGLIDYQTLLNTQRSLLTAENSQVQARLDVLVAMAQLYKALGGGWSEKVADTD